jgi:TetR/AcrR family transcriptional regulator, transcriptional repressor for nem operon
MPRTSDAKKQLIKAAGELWHSRSYAEVGVNEICEHAGVRKGSFYHFFPSKRDLALAVIDDFWRRDKQEFLGPCSDPQLKPLERIVRLVEFQCSELETLADSYGVVPGCPFGNLAVEMSTQDEVLRERLDGLFEEMVDFFEEAVEQAIAAGDVRETDARRTALAMLAYVQGMFLVAKTSNDAGLVRELAPGLLRIAGQEAELAGPVRVGR